MGLRQYSNNASSLTASLIVAADTQVTLSTGEGALFPSPTGSQYAMCTLEDVSGNLEIVRLTSRSGDLCTITRAQEGTIAQDFASGSRFELRLTKNSLDTWIQKDGDTVTGTLDLSGGGILSGGRLQNAEVVNTPIRGDTGVTTNQLVVPSGGGAPTIGGQAIYHAGNLTLSILNPLVFKTGMVMMWYGSLAQVPAGWVLCDGSSGSPDLRGRFIIGAGGSYSLGTTGGTSSATTSGSGDHTHTINGTALTVAQLPAHTHSMSNALVYPATGLRFGDNASFQTSAGSSTGSTGSGEAHTHTESSAGGHTHTVTTLPPYMGVYFIMKT
jgi:microcystin-dependent protein